jgi:hypothetical protein
VQQNLLHPIFQFKSSQGGRHKFMLKKSIQN